MREVAVVGENWLSALRTARKALGEEGGVPPGASCVMSATGEVTILDAAQRLRYTLSRSEAPAVAHSEGASAVGAGRAESAGSFSAPAARIRPTTIAYSPEESAAARAGLTAARPVHAPAAVVPAPAAAPPAAGAQDPAAPQSKSFSPSRPSSLPPLGNPVRIPELGPPPRVPDLRPPTGAAKRQVTVAYSPEESAQVRKALEQARAATPSAAEGALVSGTSPTDPAPPRPSAPQSSAWGAALPPAPHPLDPAPPFVAPQLIPNTPALLRPPAPVPPDLAPLPAAPADPVERPRRKQTLAYSPEESAAARAQLLAAQAAQASNTQALPPPRSPQELFGSRPAILVTLSSRDEEPGPSSPLTYRERSYFGPPSAKRQEVENALRDELDGLRRTLAGRPRGQYINLAVFDHAFHERPERPPIATLQWKDWRGEPALAWAGSPETTQWQPPPAEQPVKSSFFPDIPSVPSQSSIPPAAEPPAAPAPSSAQLPAQPVHPLDPLPAPLAAPVAQWLPPPAQPAANPVPAAPHVPAPFFASPTPHGVRDATGDQDKRLAIAFEASQDLYFLATPAEGLDFVVKLLHELVPCEAISGCIYDINTDEFRFVAVTGVGAEQRRAAAVPSNVGLFAVAVRSGLDSLVVRDVANEPRYDAESDGRNGLVARDMAFFTLHKADHLLGMLQLVNRRDPRGFSEGDVAVASYIANQIIDFLRTRRGLGGARR